MALLPEPKLVLPDVAARGRVAWDAAGHDIVHSAYGIALRPEAAYSAGFLLAALNSPILTFFLRHRGTDLRGGYFRMMTGYLNPFPLPPIDWALAKGERREQAMYATERAKAHIRAGEPPEAAVATLEGLPAEVLHDVVATLAEQVSDLAVREQGVWGRFSALVAALRPAIIGRADEQLRFDRAHELSSPDALIAAFAQGGAPLTAPELAKLRSAHRDMRDTLAASRREREGTVAVIDQLLYQMYVLSKVEIATIRGSDALVAVQEVLNERTTKDFTDDVSYGNQRKQRSVAGTGERPLPQKVQNGMRTISKGGQPDMLVRCVAQALAGPYSGSIEMNQAMGYVPLSSVGPHHLNTAILTGLLVETSQGWLRPTQAGRRLALDAVKGSADGVWDALLSLPAYRRYLEYKILTIVERSRARSAIEMQQIETAAYEVFPAFRTRAVSIREMLELDNLTPGGAVAVLRDPPTLEPIGRESVRAWVGAQGLGPQRTHLTRASEIAETLARAARIPLTVRSEWLEPTQLLSLLLLIVARQRGQGVVLTTGTSRGSSAALSHAVESLRLCGIDIRIEQRDRITVASLVPAISLHIASVGALDRLSRISVSNLMELFRTVVAWVKAELRAGLDGEERGAVAPAELADRCAEVTLDGVGEFISAAAADEMTPVESTITVGAPLPLASDLPLLGREYRFLEDAVRGRGKHGWHGGVAVLLSDWLTQQRRAPAEELAVNPHLALLYLIAADMGDRVDVLKRHDTGWFLANTPLALALDERLRGLGYEVWDEGYRSDEQRTHALGAALVEQGLRVGALKTSSDPAFPLEAPTTYGYYAAADLLAVEPAGRTAR